MPSSLAEIIRQHRTALTAEVLADLLSLSQKHLYKMAKSGRIPAYRIGGAWRFDPYKTAEWLEEKAA